MNVHMKVTSDLVGLSRQVDPLSRRGFFLTSSAAVAAGYTLAAGPVRADAIHTDTTGLTAGDAKIKVADGEMPAYYARPASGQNPPVILVAMEIFGLHEYIKDVSRRLAKLGAFAVAPDYYFRKGEDLTKITEMQKLMPIVNAKPDAELFSDLNSTVAWAKSQGGDTSRLGIMGFCRGGRNVLEYAAHNKSLKAAVAFYGFARGSGGAKSALAKEPDRTRAGDQRRGAWPLWRSRSGHPCLAGGHVEKCAKGRRKNLRDQNLPWRAARLSRRLPRKLSQGGGGGCLEPGDCLA